MYGSHSRVTIWISPRERKATQHLQILSTSLGRRSSAFSPLLLSGFPWITVYQFISLAAVLRHNTSSFQSHMTKTILVMRFGQFLFTVCRNFVSSRNVRITFRPPKCGVKVLSSPFLYSYIGCLSLLSPFSLFVFRYNTIKIWWIWGMAFRPPKCNAEVLCLPLLLSDCLSLLFSSSLSSVV